MPRNVENFKGVALAKAAAPVGSDEVIVELVSLMNRGMALLRWNGYTYRAPAEQVTPLNDAARRMLGREAQA